MPVWIIYAIIWAVFAGLTSVLAKSGLKGISSDLGLGIRTAFVFVLISLNVFLIGGFKNLESLSRNNFLFLGLSGLTTSLSWIFYYTAMKEGKVSIVASIDKGSILITILLSFLILREPLTLNILTGASFILIGMLILVWK